MDIVMLGADLGKNVYSVAGLDPSGRVVLRRRMKKADGGARARGTADVAGICSSLRQGAEER